MRKPVTIRVLAQELDLSVSAVSKALNDYPDIGEETKALVRRRAAELGYSPNLMARSLARKTSDFVGVVIRDVNSVYGEMYKPLSEAAMRRGLHLILYDTGNDCAVEQWCVRNLIDSMARGIVLVPVSENPAPILKLTDGIVPVVFLGGKVLDEGVSYVCADSEKGTEMALGHLLSLGHRRIAMVCDHKNSGSRNAKLAVYRRMVREQGEKERIFTYSGQEPDLIDEGYALGKRMLASGEEITAAFVMKDLMAIGVARAYLDAGKRVPEDLSLVGYDGINAAALPMVELTSVAQPREEMAERVLDILCRQAADPLPAPVHCNLPPKLVIRKSTRRPGGSPETA